MKPRLIRAITDSARVFLQLQIGNRKSPIFPLVLLCLLRLNALADSSPFLIPFQGRLTNPQGIPYTNGQYTVIFNLYDQPVGGSVLWTETHQKVGVINGMVNLFLGSINPALSSVDFTQTRHLGITIDADGNPNTPDPEMVPRQMIIPAFWAKNSERLNGFDWTSIFGQGTNSPVGPIPGAKIQGATITSNQIAPQTITAAQIASGTITSQQLAGAIITSNQIAAGSIASKNLSPGSVLTTNIADGAVTLPKLGIHQLASSGTNAGIGAIAISLSSGAFTYSGPAGDNPSSDVIVSNLTVTLAATGTRPIMVQLIPDPSVDFSSDDYGSYIGVPDLEDYEAFYVSLYRGGTKIGRVHFGGDYNSVTRTQYSPSVFSFLDLSPTAGPNTYSIYLATVFGDNVEFHNVRMIAFEM